MKSLKKPFKNMELNGSQQKALEILKSKSNIFLTGAAGTGKSYLINYYRQFNPKTPVVSSTGAAAVLVGGRTFHSFFGLGIMSQNYEVIVQNALQNYHLCRRISQANEIIVDEISMLSGKALDIANLICKAIKKRPDLPFGGIKLIVVGDFFQLPPVDANNEGIDWAFDSFSWKESNFDSVQLTEFMRTKDREFLKVLSRIRRGRVSPEEKDFLNSHMLKKDENFVGARIFARKNMVQDYNNKSLETLPGKLITFNTEFTGDDRSIEKLKKSIPIEQELKIKEDALVMIRINDTKDKMYVNGTMGFLVEVSSSRMIIKTMSGDLISLKKHTFELHNGIGNTIATAENFPVSVAYAITIHKSQGSTIDRALIELKNLWDSGQAYTALSRLSSSQGLRIIDWNESSIRVDRRVIEFYQTIQRV
jgi:ATP-dependent exoDNAse (exonuclease V) alpha subunit